MSIFEYRPVMSSSELAQDDATIDPRYLDNPKVIIKDSPIHGRGVFARVDIPAFDAIGRYEGQSTQEDGMHVLWLYDDELEMWVGIDGENEMRFLNHSNEPNAEWSETELYALRWIEAGEEITFDYGWDDDNDSDDHHDDLAISDSPYAENKDTSP